MWKFLAPRCKPRDNAIHPTAWVFCGFGFGFFIQTYFHELALASFSSLTSKNSNFGINVPVFVLLIFVKKKKKLSSISEHLSPCLSAKSYWTITQENILAAIVASPYAVRSRVHFTVAGYLC